MCVGLAGLGHVWVGVGARCGGFFVGWVKVSFTNGQPFHDGGGASSSALLPNHTSGGSGPLDVLDPVMRLVVLYEVRNNADVNLCKTL